MKLFEDTRPRIRTRSDIARLLGLPATTCDRDIRRAFDLATGCEATMEIEAEDVLTRPGTETWEVLVRRAIPCPLADLRPGTRGRWASGAAEIPPAVMAFLDLREDRLGRIVSTRDWKTWAEMRWLPPGSRRLRARHETICARVVIGGIARPTGACAWHLRISSLLDPPGPRQERLRLPVAPSEIVDVVRGFRERADAVVAEARGGQ